MKATKHPFYITWLNMRARCNNPNNKNYKNYGGRGITVCPEWDDFWQFVEDMGPKPAFDMSQFTLYELDGEVQIPTTHVFSIERKDVNKGYNKDNCVWGTPIIQAHNKQVNLA